MSTVITPFQGTDSFSTATFNNRISQINTGFSYISNPNLLDNWYFVNPVNQRGQTSYTGAGYGIDRWYLFNNITCRITPDGLTLVSNGENSIFECYLDTDLTGITATMTALIDGVVYSGSKTVDQYDFTGAVSFPGGTIRVFYSGGKTVFRLWLSEVAGTTVQLKAAKLELGSQQTLAHLENGVWVLNEIPDYGEQLARCQYHFRRIKPGLYGSFGEGYTFATTDGYCYITVPYEEMRTTPAVSISSYSDFGVAFGGNTVTPTAFATENNFVCKTSAHLSFAIPGGSGTSKPCSLIDNTGNAYIDLIT